MSPFRARAHRTTSRASMVPTAVPQTSDGASEVARELRLDASHGEVGPG
jgi:hypothetical protein